MTAHNLDLGPEAGVAHMLAVLRGLDAAGDLLSDVAIVPGVFCSFDPEGVTRGRFESRPGQLLSATFEVERPGRWLALHLQLGALDLTGQQVLGLVCRCAAPEATTFRFCLRSGIEGGFRDSFLRKTVLAHTDSSLHLDVMLLEDHPDIPATAPWRDLILFFRPEGGHIDLQDLRLFVA